MNGKSRGFNMSENQSDSGNMEGIMLLQLGELGKNNATLIENNGVLTILADTFKMLSDSIMLNVRATEALGAALLRRRSGYKERNRSTNIFEDTLSGLLADFEKNNPVKTLNKTMPKAKASKSLGKSMLSMGKMAGKMAIMAIIMEPFMSAVSGFLSPFKIITNTWGTLGTILSLKILPAVLLVNSALIAGIPALLDWAKDTEDLNKIMLSLAISVKTVKDQFIALDNVLIKFDLNKIFLKPFEDYEWDETVIGGIWNGLATKVTDGFKAVIDTKVQVVSTYIYDKFGVRL